MNHIYSKSYSFLFIAFTLVLVTFLLFNIVFVAEAQSLIPCTGVDCNFDKFIELIQNVINFLIVVIAIPLATILFAYAGWLYMSAGGDSAQIAQGHQIFRNVIMGLALALAAWLIVNTIAGALLEKEFKSKFFFLGNTQKQILKQTIDVT